MSAPETRRYSPEEVMEAVLSAGVLIEGHFVFADGLHSLNKLEFDYLKDKPKQFQLVLEALAQCEVPPADVALGVPRGGSRIARAMQVRKLITLPFAQLERVPGGGNQDFRFRRLRDRDLALSARTVLIYDDAVTSLSSIAHVGKLFDLDRQDVHAVTIWRRGRVKPEYARGITPHFLVEKELPTFLPNECPDPDCRKSRGLV